jgi:hypothetical protein
MNMKIIFIWVRKMVAHIVENFFRNLFARLNDLDVRILG